MRVPDALLALLRDRAETSGRRLVLGGERLDPRVYERLDEILQGAGGRWDKAEQAHVFPGDAAAALAEVLRTREVTTPRERVQAQQYFPTPGPVVEQLLGLAELAPGMEVLEPSAGRGAIAAALAARGCLVDAVEFDPGHAAALKEGGYARTVSVADFLTLPAEPRFDRVVMNPPFTRGTDVRHVRHALDWLRPDGLLVAVMSHATAYQCGKAARFRALVAERGGTVHPLPAGAFAESGTGVRSLIVTIPATRREGAPPVWPATAGEPAPVDVEPLPAPAVIARQIEADLRTALRHIAAIAAALETPSTPPTDPGAQLALDS